MHHLYRYLKFIDHHRAAAPVPCALSTREGLAAILELALERDALPMGAPWRPDGEVVLELERRCQGAPPGGFSALMGLAAGTAALRVCDESFCPALARDALAAWSDDDCRRRLVEAWTCALTPPSSAGTLFLMLEIEPLWGLRVVRQWQSGALARHDVIGCPIGDVHCDEGGLALVEEACISAMACMVALLRQLRPGRAYPIEGLASCVLSCLVFARGRALREHPHEVAPLMSPAATARRWLASHALEFTMSELLDAVMVPAGVLQRGVDGTVMRLDEGPLCDVHVAELGPKDQDALFDEMLHDSASGARAFGVA